MVDGGGCGLFSAVGSTVVFGWNLSFWIKMTQHNYSLELYIRGQSPLLSYISISVTQLQ